ncbi:immunoglobulin superfamily DCC subclass member 4-like [Dermacentor andersoni]|uniref:immunoglobulin superfamily DCC subclass member 4-like n=1 Tax=Dermacentor andersoni TaxID=34620 RepID=UPI002416FDEE|nr:hemicentin-2-like [Dermacentor andersoni]
MGPDILWRGLFLVILMVIGAQGYVHDSTGRVGAGACYRLEEGKRLVLDCDGLSKRSDRFPFAWMKNNRRFLPSSNGEVRLEQTRLIIEKARREDAGVYMCSDMMSTGYGQSTTGRVLHVATPVDLVPFSPRLVVRDGSTLRLRCNASAVPRPEVSWWKDGEPLPGGGRVRLLHGPPPDSLPLAQLEVSFMGAEDEAVYACKASHPACELSATTATRVFVRSECSLYACPRDHAVPSTLRSPYIRESRSDSRSLADRCCLPLLVLCFRYWKLVIFHTRRYP